MVNVDSYREADARKLFNTIKSIAEIKEIKVPKYGAIGETVNLQEALQVIKDFGDKFLGTDYAMLVFGSWLEQIQNMSSRAQEGSVILFRLVMDQNTVIKALTQENEALAQDYADLLKIVGVRFAPQKPEPENAAQPGKNRFVIPSKVEDEPETEFGGVDDDSQNNPYAS